MFSHNLYHFVSATSEGSDKIVPLGQTKKIKDISVFLVTGLKILLG